MTYSLNELESLLQKAAIGAGLPPGHAEAIAAAGVWLARRKAPVCDVIARSLGGGMRKSQVERSENGVTFQAARSAIDGIAAIDLLLAGAAGSAIKLEELDEPTLLFGLAGVAAEQHNVSFEIRSRTGVMKVSPAKTAVFCDDSAEAGTVTLALCHESQHKPESNLAMRYDPSAAGDGGWDELAALAHKTYVPASEQSRISGAGAGLTDND